MFRYLVRRILWAVVLFIAVTMVSFVIFFIVPVEPARLIAGPQAPPDAVERARRRTTSTTRSGSSTSGS